MPLSAWGIGKGAGNFVDPLVLLAQQPILGTLGNSGIPFRNIPGVLPGFGRGL